MESEKIKITQKELDDMYEIEEDGHSESKEKPEKGKYGLKDESQAFVNATIEYDEEVMLEDA